MPELYAQGFNLKHRDKSGSEVAILTALEAWTKPRWPKGVPWFALDEPRALRAPDGSIFRWEPFADGTRRLLEFTWRHSQAEAPDIQWSTRICFVVLPARTYISIRVSNTGPSFGQPNARPTTRPRLLLSLAEQFSLQVHGTSIQSDPVRLDESGFADFVRYELFDPRRRYPVAILSPTVENEYVISPQSYGREFVGIAKTYYAASAASTYALTSELGRKDLSCFHGAMRVYMPGLERDSDPARHPLVLPRRLSIKSERRRLAEVLTWLTVRTFDEEPFVAELRDERAMAVEDRRARMDLVLDEAKKRASDGADYGQLADLYATDNEQLRQTVEELREDLDEAQHKIRALQFALDQRVGVTEAGSDQALAFAPASVLDAVEEAQALFPDDLLILDSALDAAQDSPFKRPDQVAAALAGIAQVARRIREGGLGMPIKNALSELKLDYRTGISKTTPKKMRQQYIFSDGENDFVCEEHVCIGATTYDPADCLRIYLNIKERSNGKVVIGHVGRHLDGISTT